jgi:hypothetical protein
VALGVIASSLKSTVGEVIRVGGADFLVVQKGAADLSFSTIAEPLSKTKQKGQIVASSPLTRC